MRLDGKLKETSYLRNNSKDIQSNMETVKKLIDKLPEPSMVEGSYLWRNIDRKVIKGFLTEYKTYDNDRLGLTSRMPIAFIEKFADERDTDWDVALHNGLGSTFTYKGLSIGKERRLFTLKDGYIELQNRQVSSGSAESIALESAEDRKKLSNSRGETREHLPRPLLMLHILEQSFAKETPEAERRDPIQEIAAFGVSFPGSVASKNDTITLKINTVFYQNLLKQLAEEEESDD